MKQDITQHHFVECRIDPDTKKSFDAPAGGQTYSTGLSIAWQKGPLLVDGTRREPNGAFVETVIAAAIGRLAFYQETKFRCGANQAALDHLHAALGALEARTKDREDRNVEGTHQR